MPADDLVLNVRQIAGYPPIGNAPTTGWLLMQLGLGGPYQSISPQALVSTALVNGGDMAIGGALSVQSVSGGSAQFSNGAFGMLSAQKACIVDFAATYGTIGGVTIATTNDLAAQYAASVNSFNGRVGSVGLWIDDIICAGGAPIYAPRFQGDPRACTPPPTSNSSRLATTAFVATAILGITGAYAPIDSPNFTGIPSAPTAAVGSSDGQLATTAFVQNAVTESTTGVSSFNTRTGAVLLTAADLTSVGGALIASPSFTGVPTALTATPGTSSTQLATCAFVQAAVAAVTAGVSSFNSRTGDVTLTSADVSAVAVGTFNGRAGAVFLLGNDISSAGGALLAGPAFTGAPSAPTAALGTGTTQLATCAFVQAAVTAVTAGVTSWNGRAGAVTLQAADIAAVGGALLASPAFTGAPSAPTAAPGVSTTQLATTAFVQAAVSAGTAGVASFNSRTGTVTLLVADISAAGGALLASPAFTGVPTAPTALPSVSTTQLATTAFVNSVLPSASTAAPLVNGAASAGSSAAWSRGDHVHPTDTTRAAQSSLANYLLLSGGWLSGPFGVSADSDAPISCAVPSGRNARYVSNVTGVRAWGFGTRNDGVFAVADLTAGFDRLIIDGSGTTTAGLLGCSVGITFTSLGVNNFGFVWDTTETGLMTYVNAGPQGYLIRSDGASGFIPQTIQRIDGTGANAYLWWTSGGTAHWPLTGSDRKLKENLAPASIDALGLIGQIPVYEADARFIPSAPLLHWDCALIADEVGELIPRAYVKAHPGETNDYDSIRELPLIATLVKAVQQLAARLTTLEARLT